MCTISPHPCGDQGEEFILGRVEPGPRSIPKLWPSASAMAHWYAAEDVPVLNLPGPFWSRIHGELIVGGVEVFPHPTRPGLGWRTKFYRGKTLRELEHFATGPT